jgi:hypothetical protein
LQQGSDFMDKQTFLNLAPEYYMVALFLHLDYPGQYYSEDSFLEAFTVTDEQGQQSECLVGNEALRAEALRLMAIGEAIELISDPFGSAIWRRGAKYEDMEKMVWSAPTGPFHMAVASGDRRKWIFKALAKVNKSAEELGISASDFAEPQVDEWSPIPIEQAAPSLQDAVAKLDDAIQQIEDSNGYAVQHTEERRYVVDGLKALSTTLKTAATVSVQYVQRYGFELLKKVRDRFTGTLIDQSAKAAGDAIMHWIKEKAPEVIGFFLNHWPW